MLTVGNEARIMLYSILCSTLLGKKLLMVSIQGEFCVKKWMCLKSIILSDIYQIHKLKISHGFSFETQNINKLNPNYK